MQNKQLLQNAQAQLNELYTDFFRNADFNTMALQVNTLAIFKALFNQLDAHVNYQNMPQVLENLKNFKSDRLNVVHNLKSLKNSLNAVIEEA